MPVTFPNQRMINIHREPLDKDFLGIKNESWMAASRDLGATALRLYLYLAANANNFTLALSPTDIRQSIGMARSTYRDQFQILVDKGYLVLSHGNTYEFYEKPQPRAFQEKTEERSAFVSSFENSSVVVNQLTTDAKNISGDNTEINNIDFLNNRRINSKNSVFIDYDEPKAQDDKPYIF
ncbi:MAG: hypothetical protein ACI4F5_01410 [Acutalibacteraceae bacterium]